MIVIVEPLTRVVETAAHTVTVELPQVTRVIETPAPTLTVIETLIQTVEVEPGVPNPTVVIATEDEPGGPDFVDHTQLMISVAQGFIYRFRMALYHDNGTWKFSLPNGASMEWGQQKVSGNINTARLEANLAGFTLSENGNDVTFYEGIVYAGSLVASYGSVVLQHKGDGIRAGSMLEAFKVN